MKEGTYVAVIHNTVTFQQLNFILCNAHRLLVLQISKYYTLRARDIHSYEMDSEVYENHYDRSECIHIFVIQTYSCSLVSLIYQLNTFKLKGIG